METTASAGAFATVLTLPIKTQNIPPLSVLALPSFSLEGRADSHGPAGRMGSGLLETGSPPLTPPWSCLAWGSVLDDSGHHVRDPEALHS